MKLVYLINTYKNENQLIRLINALKNDLVIIFVNIDKKFETNFNKEKILKSTDTDVKFIKNNIEVYWGGFTVVRSTFNALKEIYHSNTNFDYLTLLSGQDYPIKSSEYILKYFSVSNDVQYIDSFKIPSPLEWSHEKGGIERLEYYYDFDNKNLEWDYYLNLMKNNNIKRKLLDNTNFYGGSAWWTLSYECIEYIVKYIDNNYKFLNFFKYSKHPDEMIFNTIVMNSPFNKNVVNINLRYIEWILGISHPKILTIQDIDKLLTSDKLFARKFDISVDSQILDKLDEHIL
ncbi:hypothetical protein GOQ27_16205 [Clostridium sp. D2Q-11]|uniref:Peptide O-xylosyltransferase n=1 Tax=Anaeromonas frigoriresistens TaxID=2683708 RepID=A0A942Z7Y3_9FIRM|nr:beta-1,6-N-acetylglucosaminyltransferase [Anaeromonas frigoriresistens]MBS4540021.1 hypothetical protein [Anaeromonas frigoriresistens]